MQLDLFGEAGKPAARHDRIERADWIAPFDMSDGTPAGAVKRGWRCPDPDCGEVVPTGFLLSINHGWDPTMPEREPFDGRCHKVRARLAREQRESG